MAPNIPTIVIDDSSLDDPVVNDESTDDSGRLITQAVSISDLLPLHVGLDLVVSHSDSGFSVEIDELMLARREQASFDDTQSFLVKQWRPSDEASTAAPSQPSFPPLRAGARRELVKRNKPSSSKAAIIPLYVMYNQNRSRAFRHITSNVAVGLPPGPTSVDNTALSSIHSTHAPVPDLPPFQLSDISSALSHVQDKAPGPDRVVNSVIKHHSQWHGLLLALFNACLQNTTYKLFSTFLDHTIASIVNGLVHPMQKGFVTGLNGVLHQNFLLRS